MSARDPKFLLSLAAFALATVLSHATPAAPLPLAALSSASAEKAPTPFTRDQLLNLLRREIVAHFNLEGELDLELLRTWTPPAQVANSWDLMVSEYPTLASSSMLLRCRVIADGAVVSEPTFVLRAALWRDAWATRAPLTIGAVFDPSVLETRRVDLFREREALPASVGDASFIFARGVAAGRLLTWRDVARRPLVKRGELVQVSATDGRLVVTMKGLAKENGARGDTVLVRNPDSGRDFSALVIDENRVQVRF